jgi:hypothetical protein
MKQILTKSRFTRLFFRGVKGTGTKGNTKEYKVKRTLRQDGNSHTVAIPPTTVEDLNLYNGVWLERKGDKIIITRGG